MEKKDETLLIILLAGVGIFMLMKSQLRGLPTGNVLNPPPVPATPVVDPNSGAGQAIGIIGAIGDTFGQLGDAFGPGNPTTLAKVSA